MAAARLTLRRVGEATGKLIRRPESWPALLEQASAFLGSPASRVFTAAGDEVDDIDLIESGDVVYVAAAGDDRWRPGGLTDQSTAPHVGSSQASRSSEHSIASPTLAPSLAPGLSSGFLTIGVAIGVALVISWLQGRLPRRRRPSGLAPAGQAEVALPKLAAAPVPVAGQARPALPSGGAASVGENEPNQHAAVADGGGDGGRRVVGAHTVVRMVRVDGTAGAARPPPQPPPTPPPPPEESSCEVPWHPEPDEHEHQPAYEKVAWQVATGYNLTLYYTTAVQAQWEATG